MTCADCGHENADDARFCSSCGASLGGADHPAEVRKTVTVVFTDLVGSTSLGLDSSRSGSKLVGDGSAGEKQEQHPLLERSLVEHVRLDVRQLRRHGEQLKERLCARDRHAFGAERRDELGPVSVVARDALDESEQLTQLLLQPQAELMHPGCPGGRDGIGIELAPERRVALELAPELLQVSIGQSRRPQRNALRPSNPLRRRGRKQA
jgi:hypothetical protein